MSTTTKQNTPISSPRLLLWILLAMFVAVLSVWAWITTYTIEKYYASISLDPIRALVYSPKYLSANEDEEIRFAFENLSANPVTVTLGLENNSTLIGFLGLQESNVVYSGALFSRQQINRQTKVFFYADPLQLGSLDTQVSRLGLWAHIDNARLEKKDLDIYLAPIPLARSLSYSLGVFLSGLVVALVREMWNEAKGSVRRELPLESKRIGLLLRQLWDQVKKLFGKNR